MSGAYTADTVLSTTVESNPAVRVGELKDAIRWRLLGMMWKPPIKLPR